MRDEQVYDIRTELSLNVLHSEDVTQQQMQEYAGLRQHLTGLVQEHHNIERCLKTLDLLKQLLEQKLFEAKIEAPF